MILHHYELSPYAEKIRLMLGHAGMEWQSLLSPAKPPRPNVDPLSGGYRRIPIAQIGADIFCDTALIAEEIATLSGAEELDPGKVSGEAAAWIARAEGPIFFAAISALSPAQLVGSMVKNFGPLGTVAFALDRVKMMQSGDARPPGRRAARALLARFLSDLDLGLGGTDWLAGQGPTLADFAVYHPIWLHLASAGADVDALPPNVARWYERVAAIGHGRRVEIHRGDAFASARERAPRALPPSGQSDHPSIGRRVRVAPTDYGAVAVHGTLVSHSPTRTILARDTEEFGGVHVHFPVDGYAIAPA